MKNKQFCFLLTLSFIMLVISSSCGNNKSAQENETKAEEIDLTEAPNIDYSVLPADDKENAVTEEEINAEVSGTHENHPYVDLGLPSGVKWSTVNMGADIPKGVGLHFRWGETTAYREETDKQSPYFHDLPDNISGNAKFDPARANWGGTWRLPTIAEIEELLSNTALESGNIKGEELADYVRIGPNGNRIGFSKTGISFGKFCIYEIILLSGEKDPENPYAFAATLHHDQGNWNVGGVNPGMYVAVRPVCD